MLGTSRSSAEVAVELPFTIVFEPPSWSELRALLRMRGHWVAGLIVALTIGTAYLLSTVARADAVAANALVPLALTSQPPGASVWVDGRESGVTPVALSVAPGPHALVLKARAALETRYALDVPKEGGRTFEAVLWRTQPGMTRLRAALPGATLADARLLEDGQVGLSISLPPGRELQAWRLDPPSGGVEPVLTNVAGQRLTFSPDGRHVAYVGSEIGPATTNPTAFNAGRASANLVWLTAADGSAAPMAAWRAPLESAEQLVDVSWSPKADRLLAVSQQDLAGGATRSRLWLLDADGEHARLVLSLPSEVVPGSAAWSPDGQAVGFVAHAGELNALCLLRTDGTFRYVADLDPSAAAPVGFPPLAWSADSQQMAFVAPHQHPPGSGLGWLQPDPGRALFVANSTEQTPLLLGDTTSEQVTWREDGQLLSLGRTAAEGPLSIRSMSSAAGAAAQQLLDLPLKPRGRYTATWDLQRARLLVAAQTAGGELEYWLVRLGVEDGA
jgi:hypothetical protein